MKTSRLEIVTPTRKLDMGDVSYLRAPSTDGLFGVLPRHTNAVISLEIGEITVEKEGKRDFFATSGGFAEIYSDRIILLVESAERREEIDLERAKAAAERAKKHLEGPKGLDVNSDRATIALKRALNRMMIAGKNL